jgi:hypothetical protein
LLTTRSREYGAVAEYIDLEVLSLEDALDLLTEHLGDIAPADRTEAELLVFDLGYHALAVDVAGALLLRGRGS